ncbi:tripartite motif-containing protein 16-like [Xyrichtys novacula]|uniref:Tripartite motif-containing protein 16-like n=1 Tax=Xyrichtys novacula TaxID=13765 RepID=A0AAV1HJ39_XYRNO|nr:tripartite motif-containing protein 16-like [Xyrichtys novacula]
MADNLLPTACTTRGKRRKKKNMAEREQEGERGSELEPNQFCCSVCLELFKDPVTIPCGHSYCKFCIEGCWDQNEEKGLYSCPQCRLVFSPRPVLGRNNLLAEVVEMLKKTNTQQVFPSFSEATAATAAEAGADAEAFASPGDVDCDFCCDTNPNKATMSCLTCVASYCPDHLKPHYNIPVLKKHQLVSATVPLQKKMCSKHNKLMEVYCRTDQKCICYLCVIDEHNSHKTVSAAAEREEQQKQLPVNQKKVQERGKEREKELKVLLEALKDFKKCSQTSVKTSSGIFDELISSLKKNCTSLEKLIKAQEKEAVAQAEGLQLQLEEEISKLRKTDTDLEQVSHVDDNIHFIQTFQSLSASCESPDVPNGCVVPSKHTFKAVAQRISELKNEVEDLVKTRWPSITAEVSSVNVLLQPEPKTREEFLNFCCPLNLDKNAVSKNMTLSDLKATCKTQQALTYDSYYGRNSYITTRITSIEQIWCSEALTKRCYWEVSLSGYTWCVAVSYKDKSGASSYKSEFGKDDRSWSLECSSKGCSLRHNDQSISVSGSVFSKIGVYLDYIEGILSFYSISGSNMTLLHRVDTTFTEPLYPCIGFKDDKSQQGTAYYAELVKNWS